MNILLGVLAATTFLLLTFLPLFRKGEAWSATVTPLASIMGSGFLISAPLLASIVGNYSPLVMFGLLCLAWSIGGAIRHNIAFLSSSEAKDGGEEDSKEHRLHRSHSTSLLTELWNEAKDWGASRSGSAGKPADSPDQDVWSRWINRMENVSQFVLAVAYLISVTYYIRLLVQFLFKALDLEVGFVERITAAGILIGISATGFFFGLKIIERVERYAINLNLAVIAALLGCLAVHNFQLLGSGDWSLPHLEPQASDWQAFRACLGLLVVVQGFETSRFLGSEHSAEMRIKTMGWAQVISSVIYMSFLGLMMVVITPDSANRDVDVTAIVGLVGVVAGGLPMLLIVAAVGSQFSAAVADEAGCGGLLSQLVGRWLSSRTAYLFIGTVTVFLAVSVDVLQIVSIASRAFAAFYCIQCLIACLTAWRSPKHSSLRAVWYGCLATIALAVTLVATSME